MMTLLGSYYITSKGPVDSDGTAVLAAARGGSMAVVALLLHHGASGRAALQVAGECGGNKAADMITGPLAVWLEEMHE
jgi:hypothetical protein